MKTNPQTKEQQYNCTAPLLLIIIFLTAAFCFSSCKTSTQQFKQDHFKNNKVSKVFNQKKVNTLVKAKTLRKCYAYE